MRRLPDLRRSPILIGGTEITVRIPIREEARSLNLSNSAAILCYEALRQQNLLGQIDLDL